MRQTPAICAEFEKQDTVPFFADRKRNVFMQQQIPDSPALRGLTSAEADARAAQGLTNRQSDPGRKIRRRDHSLQHPDVFQPDFCRHCGASVPRRLLPQPDVSAGRRRKHSHRHLPGAARQADSGQNESSACAACRRAARWAGMSACRRRAGTGRRGNSCRGRPDSGGCDGSCRLRAGQGSASHRRER